MKKRSCLKWLAVLLLMLVVGGLAGCGSKMKIDLSKMTSVKFEGMDTKGKAKIDIQRDQIQSTYFPKLKNVAKIMRLQGLFWGITAKADKTENLSNGDEITISFTYDEKLAKELGVVFVGNPLKVKVTDLKEVKEVDPFADVEVQFSGVSPAVSAKVVNNSKDSFVSKLHIILDKNFDLAVGDKVTAEVIISDWELEKKGYILTSTKKEFTVKGVGEHIKKYADVSEDVKKRMEQEAKDDFESKVAEDYSYRNWFYPNGGVSFTEDLKDKKNEPLKLAKIYFLDRKKGLSGWKQNKLIYIYESKSVNSQSPDGVTVYAAYGLTSLIKSADGKGVFNIDNFDRLELTNNNIDDLVSKVVNSQKGEFTVEEVPLDKK
ncbi:MAG: hypothetical protein SPL15_00380 [Lachnospiraceae bacterium]|nr:hypothetical protein [Lachnospiraceae bacterium]MDY5741445.1 hypothetical protein [Lachnospiraceae bacterium]